jgi:uncharacterized damage-inducible protein DinB
MSAYGAKELANSFRTVRANTIQIAEEIPEDKYNFVPAPGTRSVGTTLAHIALAPSLYDDMHGVKRISTIQAYDFPAFAARTGAAEQKPRSKHEIIAMLKSEGEKFATWLESLSPSFLAETFTDHTGQNPRSRLESLLSAKEHEMHHRGQLMLVQRMLGIVPHLTRRMQERMAARASGAVAGGVAAAAAGAAAAAAG